jgi:hypothetical protein
MRRFLSLLDEVQLISILTTPTGLKDLRDPLELLGMVFLALIIG